jgi:predicted enzyme related to lactoylglutathione lyase
VFFEVLGSDGDALRSFYGDLFGWKIDKTPGPMDYGWVPATTAGLDGGIAAASNGWSGHLTVYIQTDDPQATLDRAAKLGGKTLQPPTKLPGGRTTIALVADPEGHAVGLVKPPPT